MPQVIADIFLAAPAVRETWQRLENESREVRTAYWKSTSWFITSEWDAQDLDFAVRQLISVRRSVDAAEWLASQPIPHELVIQLLEAIPVDVAASPNLSSHVDDYRVAELFKKLDQSGDVSDRLVAGLEIPYIEILDHHRPQLAMHRQMINDPSLFADVICRAFKRADGQAEDSVDNQVRKLREPVAFSVLWKLRLIPGLMEDGTVHAEVLSTWVNEARRMCKDLDRQDIGDEQIGQIFANAPAGQDGIWPCEPVRALLDDLASRHIGIGFVTGKRNLRGITSRGVFDGGEQERSIAEKYRHDASRIGVDGHSLPSCYANLLPTTRLKLAIMTNRPTGRTSLNSSAHAEGHKTHAGPRPCPIRRMPESETEAERLENGVPLHPEVIDWFRGICGEFEIPFDLA